MTVEQIVMIPRGSRGVDFAYWRPGDEIAAFSYVVRYICRRPNPKAVTRAEIDFYHSLGVAVLLVFEQGQADWQQGGAKGQQQGALAASEAKLLGYPAGLSVLMAFDTNATPADPRARSYGLASSSELFAVGYRFGDYADLDVIRLLADISDINWLAGAAYWSDPTKPYQPELQPGYDLVHVRQTIAGSTQAYDNNITLRAFPAWLPHEVVSPPPTKPEEEMMEFFTHSDTDHEGHAPGFTFWRLMEDGSKRHVNGLELDRIRQIDRNAVPAIPMADIDTIPDYVAPGPCAPTPPSEKRFGTWTES